MKTITFVLAMVLCISLSAQNRSVFSPADSVIVYDFEVTLQPKCPGDLALAVINDSQQNLEYSLVFDYGAKDELVIYTHVGIGGHLLFDLFSKPGTYTLVAGYGTDFETPMRGQYIVPEPVLPRTDIKVETHAVCPGDSGTIRLLNPEPGIRYSVSGLDSVFDRNCIIKVPPQYLPQTFTLLALDTFGCYTAINEAVNISFHPKNTNKLNVPDVYAELNEHTAELHLDNTAPTCKYTLELGYFGTTTASREQNSQTVSIPHSVKDSPLEKLRLTITDTSGLCPISRTETIVLCRSEAHASGSERIGFSCGEACIYRPASEFSADYFAKIPQSDYPVFEVMFDTQTRRLYLKDLPDGDYTIFLKTSTGSNRMIFPKYALPHCLDLSRYKPGTYFIETATETRRFEIK